MQRRISFINDNLQAAMCVIINATFEMSRMLVVINRSMKYVCNDRAQMVRWFDV